MKAAIPDYMKWGAVRGCTSHPPPEPPSNAGWKTTAERSSARISSIRRRSEGAGERLQGFSIGGKVTSRDEAEQVDYQGTQARGNLSRRSPANPEAVITVCKIDGDADQDPASMRWPDLLNKGAISAERLLELEGRSASRRRPEEGLLPVSRFADVLDSWRAFAPAVRWESQKAILRLIPQALRDWLKEARKSCRTCR